MSIGHYILTKIHIFVFVFCSIVMFSTVNGTGGGTLSHNLNILLQLPVKQRLQHVSIHQVSTVAMTTLYCLQA